MFTVDVAGVRVLYTGDYSRVADRHLPAADTPAQAPDVRERLLYFCDQLRWQRAP